MRSRPLPPIAVLLVRALLVVAVVAGLGAMHALASAPSAAGSAGTHQMAAVPVSTVAEGAEPLADRAEALTTAAWSGSSHGSAPDHLMGVLAACLTVLLLVVVALAPSVRPGPQERAAARAPAAAAPGRRAPRMALSPVLRV